jgi:hypothetical protein
MGRGMEVRIKVLEVLTVVPMGVGMRVLMELPFGCPSPYSRWWEYKSAICNKTLPFTIHYKLFMGEKTRVKVKYSERRLT